MDFITNYVMGGFYINIAIMVFVGVLIGVFWVADKFKNKK